MDCSGQPKPDQANVFAQAQHHLAIQVICDLLSCNQCIVLLTKLILEVLLDGCVYFLDIPVLLKAIELTEMNVEHRNWFCKPVGPMQWLLVDSV
jgi:hypothetical protein